MTKEYSKLEQKALLVKDTLNSKFISNVVGSNLVQNERKWGEMGKIIGAQTYSKVIKDEEFSKEKQDIYNQKKAEYEKLGVYGDPSISNPEVSAKIMQQLEEILTVATLEELGKYAKEIGAKIDFEIPEELKKYSKMEILQKHVDPQTGQVDVEKLTDKEKIVLEYHDKLSKVYKRACSMNTMNSHYFSDLNQEGKQLTEHYNESVKKSQ